MTPRTYASPEAFKQALTGMDTMRRAGVKMGFFLS